MFDIDIDSQNRDIQYRPEFFSGLDPELCSKLSRAFNELKINYLEREKLIISVNFLALKDIKTAEHNIRVALLCQQIANELHIDPKALFYSGLIHDMGKALVSRDILNKKGDFSNIDMEIIKEHPLNTFRLMGDTFAFSSNVSLRHHKHQMNGYPIEMPQSKYPFSYETEKYIEYLSKILSVADFFDAAVSRQNNKFDNVKGLTVKEIFSEMKKTNPGDIDLIDNISASITFEKHLESIQKE